MRTRARRIAGRFERPLTLPFSNRRSIARVLLAAGLSAAGAAAQQPTASAREPVRLGVFFWHDSPNDAATFDGIRQGLAATHLPHEFVERRADAEPESARRALAGLRAADCRLVFAMGTQAALLCKDAVRDVPVVFAAVSNPVASGLVPDWSGSRQNLAGATNQVPPATVLAVFRRAVPDLQRLGILRSASSGVVSAAELSTMRGWLADPRAPRVELLEAIATDERDLGRAARELVAAGVQAVWIPIDLTVYQHVDAVQAALAPARVPIVTTSVHAAHRGAVVGATVDYVLHGRRAAALALQILGGADPGELPVDTMQSHLVIANLDAAERIGVRLPLPLLALADVLIDAEGRRGR